MLNVCLNVCFGVDPVELVGFRRKGTSLMLKSSAQDFCSRHELFIATEKHGYGTVRFVNDLTPGQSLWFVPHVRASARITRTESEIPLVRVGERKTFENLQGR